MAHNVQKFTLQFQADISHAKKSVAELQASLDKVTKLQSADLGLTKSINEAANAAKILKESLSNAMNTNTGQLDIQKFAQSIAMAKTSVAELSAKLLAVENTGGAAFRNLVSVVSSADVPIKKMNASLASALLTLKNTVKWNLSSGLIRGLSSAFRGAISYSKDLNSSLNDIRIVTGKSVEEMAKFAEQANKAAKSLSTTTKAYTDASLIYYQQGESAEMAAKKAAITIKAANVSFSSSAKEMSEYLTAVWNSYQVGADQLEHYVDIMAALGANTATSMEEIATSMQKVAATANTVGVSMEQISSIISTVSSVTRESAESIGTSYKTILARIGDLKLGETLEDGIGLGQVSSELDKIGVKILNTNGEMRDMGAIIEDIGSKWQNMGRAQQTALAQVVAGKRQYTQFMALFENWDKYQKNLSIAEGSDGTLQNQQDIYAESWEAASKRVRASWETVYSQIFNDEGMIKLTNGLAKVVQGISSVVEGFGGLPGVLAHIGSLVTTVFQQKIASSINSTIERLAAWKSSFQGMSKWEGFKSWLSGETTAMRNYKTMLKELKTETAMQNSIAKPGSNESFIWSSTNKIIEAKQNLLNIEQRLSDTQRAAMQHQISSASQSLSAVETITNEYNEQQSSIERLSKSLTSLTSQMNNYNNNPNGPRNKNATLSNAQQLTNNLIAGSFTQGIKTGFEYGDKQQIDAAGMSWQKIFNMQFGSGFQLFDFKTTFTDLDGLIGRFKQLATVASTLGARNNGFTNLKNSIKSDGTNIDIILDQTKQSLQELKNELSQSGAQTGWIDQVITDLTKNSNNVNNFSAAYDRMLQKLKETGNVASGAVTQAIRYLSTTLNISEKDLLELAEQCGLSAEQMIKLANAARNAKKDINGFGNSLNKGKIGQNFSKIVTSLSQATAAFSSWSSLISNWDESTLTSKVTSVSSGLTTIAMGFATGGPWGGIAAIVASALGGIIGHFEKAQKKLKEIRQETLEDWKEDISADATGLKTEQELLKNFNTLYGQYNAAEGVSDALKTATLELANAYNIEGAAISSLTGNFDELIERIRKLAGTSDINTTFLDVDESLEKITKFKETVSNSDTSGFQNTGKGIIGKTPQIGAATHQSFLEDLFGLIADDYNHLEQFSREDLEQLLQDTSGTTLDESAKAMAELVITNNENIAKAIEAGYEGFIRYTTEDAGNVEGLGFHAEVYGESMKDGGFINTNEQELEGFDISKIAQEAGAERFFLTGGHEAIFLLSENDSFEYKKEAYEAIEDMMEIMDGYSISKSTPFYESISKIYNSLKGQMDEYEKIISNAEQSVLNSTSRVFAGYTTDTLQGKDFLTEYNILYDKLVAILSEIYPDLDDSELTKTAVELANNAVALNSNLSDYGLAMQGTLEYYNNDIDKATTVLTDLINSGAELADINTNVLSAYNLSGEAETALVESVLESVKSSREAENAESNYTNAINAAESFKENMSLEEVKALQSAFDWGTNNIMSWTDFYALSYDEQSAYLNKISEEYLNTMKTSKEEAIATKQAELAEWEKALSETSVTGTKMSGSKDAKRYIDVPEEYRSRIPEVAIYKNGSDNQEDWTINGAPYREEEYAYTGDEIASLVARQDEYLNNIDFALSLLTKDEDGKYQLKDGVTLDNINADGLSLVTALLQNTLNAEEQKTLISDTKAADITLTEDDGSTFTFAQDALESYAEAGRQIAAAEGVITTNMSDLDAIMYLLAGNTESATTALNRLVDAISTLPITSEDLQKVAEALFGGDMQKLMSSTAEQRAQALLDIQNTPQLQQLETKSGMTKDEFSKTMSGVSVSTINAEWDAMAFDLDYASYIEELNNYNTAWSAAIEQMNSIPLDNLENYSSALDSLTNGYEEFVKTGKLTEEMKDSLLMAGIDPNTIHSIKDYEREMRNVEKTMQKSANTLLKNLKTYEGLENVDWSKAAQDATWEEFLNGQNESIRTLLEQFPGLQDKYEQWRQAAIEANGVMADFDASAIKASIAVEQSINAAKNELTKLTEEANKAKAAVDALNDALGQTGPLSISAQTTLAQQEMSGSNWGQDKKADLKLYGQARGKQAMADIDVLEAQKATMKGYPDFSKIIAKNFTDFKNENINLVNWTDDELNKIFDKYNFDGDAIEQAKKIIGEYAANNKTINWSELFSELAKHNADLDDQIELVWAGFADDATSAITDVLQVEQDAATKTVEIWKQAFQAISDARKGLAEGDSIAETLMGNEEDMQALIKLALDAGQSWTDIQDYVLGKRTQEETDEWIKNLTPEVTNQQYAKSQGGTSQFLYNSDGQMAQNRDEQYTNAKALMTDSYQTFYDGMDEVAKAAFDEAKASAEAQGMDFDPVAWLLEHYFPDYDSATGTSLNAEESQKAYNADAAGVYTFETNKSTSEAQAEYDTAKQKYDTVYEEESQNISDWQAIQEAILAVKNGEAGTTAEALGEEAAGIMERQGIGSLEELNGLTLSDVNQNIGSAVINVRTAEGQFMQDTEALRNQGIDSTIDEGQEEIATQTAEVDATPGLMKESAITSLASSVDMTTEEFKQFTDAMIEAGEVTAETVEGQYEQARSLARIKDGLKTVRDSMKDWKKSLKDTQGDAIAHNKVLSQMRESFEDVLDMPTGALNDLSEEFMTSAETAELLEGAMKGDLDSYNQLQAAVAKEILIADNIEVSPKLQAAIDTISTAMDNLPVNQPIAFGELAHVSPQLYAALNEYIGSVAAAGGDVAAAAAGLGFDLQYIQRTIPASAMSYQYEKGGSFTTEDGTFTTVNASLNEETGDYTITAIKAITNKGTHGGGIGSSGGSGGSGGGGGGGKQKKKHDKRDKPERYHENTKNYDRVSEALEKVNKAKDRAFGKSYLKNLEKERELLNAQVNLLKEKEDEIQNYYDEDLTNLQNELNALMGVLGGENIALDIDPNTLNINNWEEIEAKITELYNKKADLKMSDEEWEKIEEQLSKYEEMRDQYEETVALLAENGLTIEDLLNQMSELALEEITYKVEYQVELNDADLELLEYYQEVFEDDLGSASELMANLSNQAGIAQSNLSILETGLNELNAAYAAGEINAADYQEGIADINSQMIDQLSELHDIQDEIAELYADTLDMAQEEMDVHLGHLDHVADVMEHYTEIFDLMGQGTGRAYKNSLMDVQIAANKESLTAQSDLFAELLERKKEFEANMDENGNFSTELEQQQYEALLETLTEVHGNMMDAVAEGVDLLAAKYENTIEKIFEDFEERMLGANQSIADVADKYEYYQETQNRQLSAAQELYEMSKLNRQIEQSIEDSTIKANKQILKDLQAQINARAELKDMTEYDIEMMNLQYELALKQMALEDAQNAKSVVRLTRDNDGNYAYQYTADDDKVASAYQEYEDVLQQINDLASGRVGELEQAMLDAQQQYADAAKEIALDMTLTETERQAKLEELAKRYEETLLYIQDEYGYATSDLKNNLAATSDWYNTALVEDSNAAQEQVADMIKNAQTWAQEYADLLKKDGPILSAWNNYAEAVAAMETILTEEGMKDYKAAVENAGKAMSDVVSVLEDELTDINAVTQAWKDQASAMDEAIKRYETLAAKMNDVMRMLAELEEAQGPALGDASSNTSDDGKDVSFADPEILAAVFGEELASQYTEGKITQDQLLAEIIGTVDKTKVQWDDLEDAMQVLWEYQLDKDKDEANEEYKKAKELIDATGLNLEEIWAQLEAQTQAEMANMSSWAMAQTLIKDSTVNYNNTQNITMTNEFPNVESIEDIKQAFEELFLYASQYVNGDGGRASGGKVGGGGGGGGGGKRTSPPPV